MQHSQRRHVITELQHQLRLASTASERESIRRELEFWLHTR